MKKIIFFGLVLAALQSVSILAGPTDESIDDFELKLLGKYLFFDNISLPSRQSCATCHTPDAGWTNGTSSINLHQVAVTGANPHTVGTLKPPSNAYASFVPNFSVNGFGARGGNFWNGRATGDEVQGVLILNELHDYFEYLGPTADQAHASPFINPVEQGLEGKVAVCEHVAGQKYAALYPMAFEEESLDCESNSVTIFARFALALSAYQHSSDVNAFDSKRDKALANDAANAESPVSFPLADFTDQENLGHDLFYGETSDLNPDGANAGCAAFCHVRGGFGQPRDGTRLDETYAGNGFFNIGTPLNPEIPGNPGPDEGLAGNQDVIDHLPAIDLDRQRGKQRIPTLRNVDKRRGVGFKKAYTHNGWFKSLESIVSFYNTRDVKVSCALIFPDEGGIVTEREALANDCWPPPAINDNVFTGGFGGISIGDLQLEAEEEAAIVVYLKTLTDDHTAKAPPPFNLRMFNKRKKDSFD